MREVGRSVEVEVGGNSGVEVGTEDRAEYVEDLEAEESLLGSSSERGLGLKDFPQVGLPPPPPPPLEARQLGSRHS